MTAALSIVIAVRERAPAAFSTIVGVPERAPVAFSTVGVVQEKALAACACSRMPHARKSNTGRV